MPELSVRPERALLVVALRHFTHTGEQFGAALRDVLEGPLALPGCAALRAAGADTGARLFVWRSPTENWVFFRDRTYAATLEARCAMLDAGCMVDLTGSLAVWYVSGARAAEFLARIGGSSLVPAVGAALTGQFAEVTATLFSVRPGEVTLAFDRMYADHVQRWMRETAADLEPQPVLRKST